MKAWITGWPGRGGIAGIRTALAAGLALALVLGAPPAAADVLVLVQGMFGKGSDWRATGVTAGLVDTGWSDGGHLSIDGAGVFVAGSGASGPRTFYTLQLPTQLGLRRQLPVLERYVDHLRRVHENESLYLAGHSAGGVLARLYMVEHPDVPVAALVTIASPNLGSDSAELGAAVASLPMLQLFGDIAPPELRDWYEAVEDLRLEQPGTFLYWLNRQPHPSSRYIAVVHVAPPDRPFDELVVSTRSQELGRVASLIGRVETVRVEGGHALAAGDARLLSRLLSGLSRT